MMNNNSKDGSATVQLPSALLFRPPLTPAVKPVINREQILNQHYLSIRDLLFQDNLLALGPRIAQVNVLFSADKKARIQALTRLLFSAILPSGSLPPVQQGKPSYASHHTFEIIRTLLANGAERYLERNDLAGSVLVTTKEHILERAVLHGRTNIINSIMEYSTGPLVTFHSHPTLFRDLYHSADARSAAHSKRTEDMGSSYHSPPLIYLSIPMSLC